ncbi:hypothetical protein [Craterilacuibacter sp. RT1T]|uniref:hypothetical protein n=1 Tax=Craterilacuibacter sp. RT1T TaxID=2942211 RepID=UPI0020BFD877|nr:hypothetical protein [Craterilacuibacter sp. RT1T]MCL6263164.1 hypothetical protein [Craterilacuibacter sp. RT1T]
MKNARDYLEEALLKMGEISDAKKAEKLKISRQSISAYRKGERIMDDFMCIMVARELGIDPLEVIAAANMEREKTTERKDFWEDFRKQIGVLGVAGLVMMGTVSALPAKTGNSPMLNSESVHYVK